MAEHADHSGPDQDTMATPNASEAPHQLPFDDDPPSSPLSVHDESEFTAFHTAKRVEIQSRARTMEFWTNHRRSHLSFENFLRGWILCEDSGPRASTNRVNRLIAVLQEERIAQRLSASDSWRDFLALESAEDSRQKKYHKLLQKELATLAGQPGFRTASETPQLDPDSFKTTLAQVEDTIQSKAPAWTRLLTEVVKNSRSSQASYKTTKVDPFKGFYAILAIMTRVVALSSGFLSNRLGLFLMSSGVSRDVIDVLSALGICESYSSLHRKMATLAERAQVNSIT